MGAVRLAAFFRARWGSTLQVPSFTEAERLRRRSTRSDAIPASGSGRRGARGGAQEELAEHPAEGGGETGAPGLGVLGGGDHQEGAEHELALFQCAASLCFVLAPEAESRHFWDHPRARGRVAERIHAVTGLSLSGLSD